MKIITLIDSSTPSEQLEAEHGLAVYIETNDRKILFDTGRSASFISNAAKLGVKLWKVDTVIISHGHYDHIGGLIDFLKLNTHAIVYLKKEIFDYQYFSVKNNRQNNIGYPPELESFKERFRFLENDVTCDGDLYLFREIKRTNPLPKGNKMLFRADSQMFENDNFDHELILSIVQPQGVAVFTGCAHNGIVNMLHTVKKYFQHKNIALIYGGLHLLDERNDVSFETSNEMDEIVRQIEELAPMSKLITGHCTGRNALCRIRQSTQIEVENFFTGYEVVF